MKCYFRLFSKNNSEAQHRKQDSKDLSWSVPALSSILSIVLKKNMKFPDEKKNVTKYIGQDV